MIPKHGGAPLPPSPDCLPRAHADANRYASAIQHALDQPGWSPKQRTRLRDLYRKWILRAEGRDPYFERYGTFPRPEGAPPPTTTDLIVARWRRRHPRPKEDRKSRELPRKKYLLMRRRERTGGDPGADPVGED